MTEEHSSCSRTAADHSKSSSADKGLQYYLLSFLAAFIACLCCSLPLLALALGLAGASGIKGYMGKYHDLYQFAAVSILLGACVFMWLQKKKGRMSLKGCLSVSSCTCILNVRGDDCCYGKSLDSMVHRKGHWLRIARQPLSKLICATR